MAENSPLTHGFSGHTDTRRSASRGLILLLPMALLVSSAVVYQASNAAFTAQTANSGNSWTAGQVTLTDDDAGSALFNATGITGGQSGSRCIVVTYQGSVNANVRLYASNYTNSGLGQYLDLTIQEGTGSSADCSDFASSATLFNDTLNTFATANIAFGSGLSSWAAPGGTNPTKTYRFSWSLQNNNAAQSKSAGTDFTWEAQSS